MGHHRLKRILRRVRKLLYWFPVIFRDYDWDHVYILIMLHHKLKLVEKDMGQHRQNQAHNVHLANLCLNRLIERDYEKNAMANHRREWGKMISWLEPTDDNMMRWCSRWENAATPEQEKQADREFTRCMRHADWMRQQDLDLLCQTVSKHLLYWWS